MRLKCPVDTLTSFRSTYSLVDICAGSRSAVRHACMQSFGSYSAACIPIVPVSSRPSSIYTSGSKTYRIPCHHDSSGMETHWSTTFSSICEYFKCQSMWHQGPSVNNEYLSQIQLYSIFSKLPVMSNTVDATFTQTVMIRTVTVLIITVCVKVAKSTFLVTNKRTKWAELSRYYLYNCFVR